jgi:hypothetical protein
MLREAFAHNREQTVELSRQTEQALAQARQQPEVLDRESRRDAAFGFAESDRAPLRALGNFGTLRTDHA